MSSTVLLDIKKAFDTIDHKILLTKMDHYGIRDEELGFFNSYLTDRQQCCSVNNFKSSFKNVKLGVPQGSNLGPLLFIMFMNDLPNCLENAAITMYADDTSASTTIESVSDVEYKLIPDMVKIFDWLKSIKLSLNALKTEFMITGTNRNVHNTTDLIAVRVDGALIRRVNKSRYLGLIVDDRLSWKEHISYISSKVSRNIGILKRVRERVTKETLLIMYGTLIEPYFRYCNTT